MKRCLNQLRSLGFLTWCQRLIRNTCTGWRTEQATNAYALRVAACEAQFAREVRFSRIKKESPQKVVSDLQLEELGLEGAQGAGKSASGNGGPAARFWHPDDLRVP